MSTAPTDPKIEIDADLAAQAGEDLLYEVRDNIGFLTFNRPQSRNAMTFAMYERMAQICVDASEKRDIRALVLTGAARSTPKKTPWPTKPASTARSAPLNGAAFPPSRRSAVPAPAAVPASPPAVTCASRRADRGSGFRSRARWAIAFR